MILSETLKVNSVQLDGVLIQTYARKADNVVMVDVMDGGGDWIYARMTPEQAKELAKALTDACEALS